MAVHAAMGMGRQTKARFSVVSVMYSPGNRVKVTLEDLDGPVSITNDAEAVVKEVYTHFNKDGGRELTILYYDTDKVLSELLHENGEFRGFQMTYRKEWR